ncbi:MAG: PilZ domain-containing protein [Sedimenticola sp.]
MTSDTPNDRRLHQRILFDAPTILKVESKHYHSSLIDISLKGVLLVRPGECQLNAGDSATVEIALAEGGPAIEIQGEVVHANPDILGITCIHIGLESIGHLRRLVELNLGDSDLLDREFEALLR